MWFVGILLLTGWKWETQGVIDIAPCIVPGLLLLFLAPVFGAILHWIGVHPRRMTPGVALAVAIIFIEVSFPVGAFVGSIWNATAGTYPDMSGLANRGPR